MKQIIIIGGNFINKGAESMLMATVDGIRKNFPGYEPVLVDLFPSKTESEKKKYDFRIINMHVRSLFRISFPVFKLLFRPKGISDDEKEVTELFKSAMALFDISGYGLSSHNQAFLWSMAYLLPLRLAKKNHVPAWLLPQSFGPFDFKGLKRFWFSLWGRSLLNYPEVAFVREPEGLEALKAVRHKLSLLSSDIVLQREITAAENEYPEVVVIPNRQLFNFVTPDKVAGLFAEIISSFLEKGLKVRLLRHSRDDEHLCDMISERVSHSALFLDKKEYLAEELINIISKAKMVVSARYHGVVHAFICQKPALIIGWATKYRHLANLFGVERFLLDIHQDQVDDFEIGSLVDTFVASVASQEDQISDKLKEIRKHKFWDYIKLPS